MSRYDADPINPPLEDDREFKAHIYQQLVDLQPFLAPDSQVAVLVQPSEENAEDFTLTLVTNLGEYRIEAEGDAPDVYDAFDIAKERMLEQLEEAMNSAIDPAEREAEIQSYLDGSHLLH
jgi:ribosome-associated translation inhibitor RaiA